MSKADSSAKENPIWLWSNMGCYVILLYLFDYLYLYDLGTISSLKKTIESSKEYLSKPKPRILLLVALLV